LPFPALIHRLHPNQGNHHVVTNRHGRPRTINGLAGGARSSLPKINLAVIAR
jgi:hypothetical protein